MRAMVLLATRPPGADAASDAEEEEEEEECADDVSAAPEATPADLDTFDLLEKIGILRPRTKVVHRRIIISAIGALIGVVWAGIFADNALQVNPELEKSYAPNLLRPTFWVVALVGLLLGASVGATAHFMGTDGLRECVEDMQEEGSVKILLRLRPRLRRLGSVWQCEGRCQIMMQAFNLGKWVLIIFGGFWSTVTSSLSCLLAGVVVFVFLSSVSDAYMFGQTLAEALSEAMIHRVIESVGGAEPGHDWQEAIKEYLRLRTRLEDLWEGARFVYLLYGLALAVSAFLFTCWLFVSIHRRGPGGGLEVQTLVGCLFFLLYCLGHLVSMIWRLCNITRLCQSTRAADDSILNAALEKLASIESAEERRGCREYVIFLMSAPTGVRIFVLFDSVLLVSAAVPMVTGFVSCVSYTLVQFEMAGDDYVVTPENAAMAVAGFVVLLLYEIALRWVDHLQCLREQTD